MNEVYHEGEREIQQITGEEIKANSNGRVIAKTIVKGAFNFISNQPMLIVSSTDRQGALWTSALIGDFGFVSVADEVTITINPEKMRSVKDDVFFKNIIENPQVGMLFMEPATRRRFRVNGNVVKNENLIEIKVEEAYPNCPKYIQKRTVSFTDITKSEHRQETTAGTRLTQSEIDWIASADTLFVGSSAIDGRLDASHRGGGTGFVEVLENNTIKIPDYAGNSMYNTLGNFIQNPNAGLVFIDFQRGKTLQLTGKAALLFNQKTAEDFKKTTGTGRYWLFKIENWIRIDNHHSANWEFEEFSPFNP